MQPEREGQVRIAVGVDATERHKDAMALARVLGSILEAEVAVAHVHPVVPRMTAIRDDAAASLRAEAAAILDRAAERAGEGVSRHLVADESASRGLHRFAQEQDADLLVVGSSHRGRIGHALLGSVAERVIHGAPCAIAVAPVGYAEHASRIRCVGVAFDGGDEAWTALHWGERLATRAAATMTLYHVIDSPDFSVYPGIMAMVNASEFATAMRESQQAVVDRAVDTLPRSLEPHGELLMGPVARALETATSDCDLMVCGSRGFGAVGGVFLGSVARELVHGARCPVVVLPRTAVEARARREAAVAGTQSEVSTP